MIWSREWQTTLTALGTGQGNWSETGSTRGLLQQLDRERERDCSAAVLNVLSPLLFLMSQLHNFRCGRLSDFLDLLYRTSLS